MACVRMNFEELDIDVRCRDELQPFSDLRVWAGVILNFLEHTTIMSDNTIITHRFACVDFFMPSEDKQYFYATESKNTFSVNLAELWAKDYIPQGTHTLVPIHRLLNRCIFGSYEYNDDDGDNLDKLKRVLIIPLPKKIIL